MRCFLRAHTRPRTVHAHRVAERTQWCNKLANFRVSFVSSGWILELVGTGWVGGGREGSLNFFQSLYDGIYGDTMIKYMKIEN